MEPTKHGGTRVNIAGAEFEVPGISVRHLRRLVSSGDWKRFESIQTVPSPEEMDLILDTVTEAMRRNYPAFAREFLEDNISPVEATELLKLVFTGSGLYRTKAAPGPNGAGP